MDLVKFTEEILNGKLHFFAVFAVSVCTFNSLPNRGYLRLFNVAAFCNKSSSVKTNLPVKNLYSLTFPDEKGEILAFCPSKLYLIFFGSIFPLF